MRAPALALILCMTAAHAEVSITIPAPPKRPPTAGESERDADLLLDREAWLAQLSKVRGAKVVAWSQGADVDCPARTRARLEHEGFLTRELITVMDEARAAKRPISEQVADLLGGGLAKKVAIRLAPGVWVAVTPRPGIAPKEYRARWLKVLQGLNAGGLAKVSCYLHREFRLPVGGVCAEVDISSGTLAELAQIVGLARRALTANGIRPGPSSPGPAPSAQPGAINSSTRQR